MRGMNAEGALLPSGGYRALRSTRVAEVLYDAAAAFCGRFIPKGSRTHDQRVQAARSGIGWRQGVRGRPRPLVGTPRRGVRGGFGETALPPCPPRPLCPPPIRRMSSVAGGDARAPCGFARNTCCAANTLLCAAHQATYLLCASSSKPRSANFDKNQKAQS